MKRFFSLRRFSISRVPALLGASFLFALLVLFNCGQLTSTGKKAGHSCILQGVACSALPKRVCGLGKGYYRPYTCKSVGYRVGPCSRDSYGAIYAKTPASCQRIKVLRGGR